MFCTHWGLVLRSQRWQDTESLNGSSDTSDPTGSLPTSPSSHAHSPHSCRPHSGHVTSTLPPVLPSGLFSLSCGVLLLNPKFIPSCLFHSSTQNPLVASHILRRCSVAKSCLTLCDPEDCSMPGFPVLHYLPELAQTHAY